jgi:hypothetical protein
LVRRQSRCRSPQSDGPNGGSCTARYQGFVEIGFWEVMSINLGDALDRRHLGIFRAELQNSTKENERTDYDRHDRRQLPLPIACKRVLAIEMKIEDAANLLDCRGGILAAVVAVYDEFRGSIEQMGARVGNDAVAAGLKRIGIMLSADDRVTLDARRDRQTR